MFEAVIFDWDGTLADTRQVIVISFQKALERNKLSKSATNILNAASELAQQTPSATFCGQLT